VCQLITSDACLGVLSLCIYALVSILLRSIVVSVSSVQELKSVVSTSIYE
jgi:hypothetical protein